MAKTKKNFSIGTAEEFIAAITRHTPEKSFQLVRYHGWYSNRMRGDRRKLEEGATAKGEKKGKDTLRNLLKPSNPRKPPHSTCLL